MRRLWHILLELGEKKSSLELLNKIRNLEWSKTYYPDMPQYLTDLTLFVQSGEAPSQPLTSGKKKSEQPLELIISEDELTVPIGNRRTAIKPYSEAGITFYNLTPFLSPLDLAAGITWQLSGYDTNNWLLHFGVKL